MKLVTILAGVLFVAAWPVLLVSSTVTWVANDPDFYLDGFKKYDIAAKTGIAEADLYRVPQEFVDYYNSDREYLDITVTQRGQRVALFNQREIEHMKDVKGLIRLGNLLQWWTLLYVAVVASIGLFWWRGARRRTVYRFILWGSLATLGVIFAIGAMAVINFDAFFLLFHLVSFTNTLWILDPAKDNLIQMFPEGVFSDGSAYIGGLVVLEAAIGCGFMLALLKVKRRPKAA